MFTGKLLKQIVDKFNTSPAAQEAPSGAFHLIRLLAAARDLGVWQAAPAYPPSCAPDFD